ncbi:hypothetical protein [Roseomonas xinghualingensis]|uniref:hypothetical protein n=1 Tax=Roseomonas xinghualingensis TaxID=2986475 RepID=UPI0021F1F70A|nr:hypothetical protein [Roseomonas sp. SXEYE001]MCV4208761.1 hypothetical protein [Roseomonas sp. SXEYE001]
MRPVVETAGGGGARLTARSEAVVQTYCAIEADANAASMDRLTTLSYLCAG